MREIEDFIAHTVGQSSGSARERLAACLIKALKPFAGVNRTGSAADAVADVTMALLDLEGFPHSASVWVDQDDVVVSIHCDHGPVCLRVYGQVDVVPMRFGSQAPGRYLRPGIAAFRDGVHEIHQSMRKRHA